MLEIAEDVLGSARSELAKKGWAVLRPARFMVGGEPDEDAVVEIASWFGVPSRRDADRAVWRVAPVTSRPDATFSQRTGEAGLHTDAQYRRRPEDVVCLFVVRPALAGGATRLLTVADAAAAVRRHPRGRELLEALARPAWSWETPEVFEAETGFRAAVMPGDGTIRWRADNLAASLSAEQLRVAAVFEACIETAPEVVELPLDAGDVLLLDNRTTLHGRTDFSDPRRLLLRVRLWEPGR